MPNKLPTMIPIALLEAYWAEYPPEGEGFICFRCNSLINHNNAPAHLLFIQTTPIQDIKNLKIHDASKAMCNDCWWEVRGRVDDIDGK